MKLTATATKEATIWGEKVTIRYELFAGPTHHSIKEWRPGEELPKVSVGAPAYIAKLWKEKTRTKS